MCKHVLEEEVCHTSKQLHMVSQALRMPLHLRGQIHEIIKLQMKSAAKNADRDLAVHITKEEQMFSVGHS